MKSSHVWQSLMLILLCTVCVILGWKWSIQESQIEETVEDSINELTNDLYVSALMQNPQRYLHARVLKGEPFVPMFLEMDAVNLSLAVFEWDSESERLDLLQKNMFEVEEALKSGVLSGPCGITAAH